MLNFFLETGLRILKGLVDAFTARVVLPAMIGTADAVFLDESVIERYAAVRTLFGDESVISLTVSIENLDFRLKFLLSFLVFRR